MQAAVVNLGNMLLSVDKEAAMLKAQLQQRDADALAHQKQLQAATQWLHEAADRLKAGKRALAAVQ